MIFGIQLPQWLIDFWAVYGGAITPILVTLGVSILTYIAIKIKSDAKVNAVKADMQIQALQEVASKDTGTKELDAQGVKLERIAVTLEYMLQMYELAFQNSELDPAIKENLTNLANCVRYGSQEELVKEQQKQIDQLNQQIADLTNQMNQNVVEEVTKSEEPVTVERR